jgi:hypothetical protein
MFDHGSQRRTTATNSQNLGISSQMVGGVNGSTSAAYTKQSQALQEAKFSMT